MTGSTNDRPEWAQAWVTSCFTWPFFAMAAASEALATETSRFAWMLGGSAASADAAIKPPWMTPNHVRLELATMELRDFSTAPDGAPVLVCAPFAVHGSTITDLAPGHSLVEALARGGCHHLFVTDWRSATPDMRLLTIDSYLADLNVAVDEIGAPADLVGLCQGGWLALLYAARFPAKVRKVVLAGAPIDLAAAPSQIATAVAQLPLGLFEDFIRQSDGRVPGRRVSELWPLPRGEEEAAVALQLLPRDYAGNEALLRRFREWDAWTVDLPGPFHHQVVLWLFKENRLAEGRFTALGRRIDLADVRHPLFLLAARDDLVVPPDQLLSVRRLVGTRPEQVTSTVEAGGHLALFIGGEILRTAWSRAARWLAQPSST